MRGVVDSKFIRALPPDPLNQDSEGAWHSLGQEANKARELKKKKIDRAIKATLTLNLHDKVCEAVGCKYLYIVSIHVVRGGALSPAPHIDGSCEEG